MIVVMLVVMLAPISAFGETGMAVMDASGASDVTITQAMDDIIVGLGADPMTIDLTERFDDLAVAFVRFDFRYEPFGAIDVKLFQAEAPKTVANFLNYVNDGAYTNSFIHRAPDPDFVVQGGGFALYKFDETPQPEDYIAIPQGETVDNEPGISNVAGTIAMAKVGGDPDSATNQWFFNVVDNPSLDNPQNNGGFTVFGEVMDDGMAVIQAIADLPIENLSNQMGNSAFTHLPLITYAPIGLLPDENDLVMINAIEQLPELSFTVQNDRPDLVAASVEDGALQLDFAKHQSGAANITVRATAISDGRFVEDAFVVTVEEWGDLDGDGDVDLADAVVALRVEAGLHPESDSPPALREDYGSSGADVDGNGQVEMSETLYILQKVSGLKP